MPTDPSPSDFVRPTTDAVTESGEPVPDGIYRVVGTPPDSVTLLRVGDPDGTREVTGVVYAVSRDTYRASFERASEPSGRGLLWAAVERIAVVRHNLLRPIYWLKNR